MVNIYEFESLSSYLKAVFEDKKKANPMFSIRAWCKVIGVTSPGALNQIVNGKRDMPLRHFDSLSDYLEIGVEEQEYLKELFFSSKVKKDFRKRLQKLNPLLWKKKNIVKNKKVVSNFMLFTLRDLLKRADSKDLTFEDLRREFCEDISDEEIGKAYYGYMEYSDRLAKKGRLKTEKNKTSESVQNVHEYFLELAQKRLKSVPVEKRNFTNFSINIDESRVEELKKRIEFYTDSLIEEFDDDKNANVTYHLGSLLYPVTEKRKTDG